MKTYRQIAIALLLNSLSLAGQEILPNETTFDPRDLDRVDLKVRLIETNAIFPALPIILDVALTNLGTETLILPLPILSARDRPENTLDVFLVDDEKSQRVEQVRPSFGPWKEGLPIEWPQLLRLPPHGGYSLKCALSYDWYNWQRSEQRLITREGTLRLFVKLNSLETIPNSKAKRVRRESGKASEIIAIDIQTPPGDAGAAFSTLAAFERKWMLGAPEAADYFGKRSDRLFFENLVQQYPRTSYALYAKAVLAHMHARADGAIPRDLNTALRLLGEAREDPRFLLQDDLNELERRIELLRAKPAKP